jgi:drug/metabolite transporter (DMT)-like permease
MAVIHSQDEKWKGYDDILVGIFYCLASTFLFWVVNALGKVLAETYPIPLLVFFRSTFALIMCLALASRLGGLRSLRAQRPAALVIRGVAWVLMLGCSFASYHLLPIGDAAAIEFVGPIFIAVLGGAVLGESVGMKRWLAILVGFIGVALVVRPWFSALHYGMLFALGNALFYAVGSLLVRRLSRTDSVIAIVFYSCLVSTAISAMAVPYFWVSPTPFDLALLCALGIFGALAQYLVTQSFYYAPASIVSPFTYSGLIWALLLGFLIWNDVPDLLGLFGAIGIVVSGLWLARLRN